MAYNYTCLQVITVVVDLLLMLLDDMKVLGMVLDCRLTFDSHVTAVARACNYHPRAIRHIHHQLMAYLALMLMVAHSSAPVTTPLAADSPANRLQVGCVDVQGLQHFNACLP